MDGAAHLVDRVLPSAPYRQLVLSLPYKLRIHLARDPRFLSSMLGGYLKSVFAWQRHRGRFAGIDDGHTGAITFVQRFGGALNVNVHFHSLTPDGLFVADPATAGGLSFVPLEPPSGEDIARLGRRVFRRLTKIASRYLAEHDDDDADVFIDPDDEQSTLQHALSVALRPPVRPVRPQPALPLGGLGGPQPPDHAPPETDLCTAAAGFSLHAARTVEAHDREGLEGLCRYGLRAPFSQQRLDLLPSGQVRYELARPWPTPTGVTELIMEPLQFLKRLAALLPAPYQNLTRYHGVFANRSRYRPLLPLPPQARDDRTPDHANALLCSAEPKSIDDADDADDTLGDQQGTLPLEVPGAPHKPQDLDASEHTNGLDIPDADPPALRPRRLPWASLLKRSLGINGLECPRCGAQMALLALITAPAVVARILEHLRLPSTPPPVSPARPTYTSQRSLLPGDELDQTDPFDENEPAAAASWRTTGPAAPRAPP